MADTEQSMGETEAKTPEVFDSGASSGTATDFTQVKPLSESEDPAHANFLPTEGHDVPEGLISDREGEES
ncbi:MAG: hypothetical protein WD627_00120 [Actinomycetota bacterium]